MSVFLLFVYVFIYHLSVQSETTHIYEGKREQKYLFNYRQFELNSCYTCRSRPFEAHWIVRYIATNCSWITGRCNGGMYLFQTLGLNLSELGSLCLNLFVSCMNIYINAYPFVKKNPTKHIQLVKRPEQQ